MSDTENATKAQLPSLALLAELKAAQAMIMGMAEQIIDPPECRLRFVNHARAIGEAQDAIKDMQARPAKQAIDKALLLHIVRDLDWRIHNGYDWNADPDFMTRRVGDVLSANAPDQARLQPSPAPASSALAEIAQLLNDGENREALNELRRMHGLVNRFVCETCGHTCDSVTEFRCPECGGKVNVRVVVENPNAGRHGAELARLP